MRLPRSSLLVSTFILPLARADVHFTSPAAGSTVAGDAEVTVEWRDSGLAPSISDLTSYQLSLCAGSNHNTVGHPLVLFTVVLDSSDGAFGDGNKARVFIPSSFGPSSPKNAYYLKSTSLSNDGGTVINYSDRFSLSDMSGVFSSALSTDLESVTDSTGPAAPQFVAQLAPRDPQVVAAAPVAAPAAAVPVAAGVAPAGGAAPAAVPVAGGAAAPVAPAAAAPVVPPAGAAQFNVPYTMQTGNIKYAPMQPVPPTKISAANASPQYPTSAVTYAVTYLPTPNVITTVTQPLTYQVTSHENQASPAPMPQDDMQKFLNRWKD